MDPPTKRRTRAHSKKSAVDNSQCEVPDAAFFVECSTSKEQAAAAQNHSQVEDQDHSQVEDKLRELFADDEEEKTHKPRTRSKRALSKRLVKIFGSNLQDLEQDDEPPQNKTMKIAKRRYTLPVSIKYQRVLVNSDSDKPAQKRRGSINAIAEDNFDFQTAEDFVMTTVEENTTVGEDNVEVTETKVYIKPLVPNEIQAYVDLTLDDDVIKTGAKLLEIIEIDDCVDEAPIKQEESLRKCELKVVPNLAPMKEEPSQQTGISPVVDKPNEAQSQNMPQVQPEIPQFTFTGSVLVPSANVPKLQSQQPNNAEPNLGTGLPNQLSQAGSSPTNNPNQLCHTSNGPQVTRSSSSTGRPTQAAPTSRPANTTNQLYQHLNATSIGPLAGTSLSTGRPNQLFQTRAVSTSSPADKTNQLYQQINAVETSTSIVPPNQLFQTQAVSTSAPNNTKPNPATSIVQPRQQVAGSNLRGPPKQVVQIQGPNRCMSKRLQRLFEKIELPAASVTPLHSRAQAEPVLNSRQQTQDQNRMERNQAAVSCSQKPHHQLLLTGGSVSTLASNGQPQTPDRITFRAPSAVYQQTRASTSNGQPQTAPGITNRPPPPTYQETTASTSRRPDTTYQGTNASGNASSVPPQQVPQALPPQVYRGILSQQNQQTEGIRNQASVRPQINPVPLYISMISNVDCAHRILPHLLKYAYWRRNLTDFCQKSQSVICHELLAKEHATITQYVSKMTDAFGFLLIRDLMGVDVRDFKIHAILKIVADAMLEKEWAFNPLRVCNALNLMLSKCHRHCVTPFTQNFFMAIGASAKKIEEKAMKIASPFTCEQLERLHQQISEYSKIKKWINANMWSGRPSPGTPPGAHSRPPNESSQLRNPTPTRTAPINPNAELPNLEQARNATPAAVNSTPSPRVSADSSPVSDKLLMPSSPGTSSIIPPLAKFDYDRDDAENINPCSPGDALVIDLTWVDDTDGDDLYRSVIESNVFPFKGETAEEECTSGEDSGVESPAVQMESNKDPHCNVCGKKSPLFLCALCFGAVYCGRECQIKDWASHRHNCTIKTKTSS